MAQYIPVVPATTQGKSWMAPSDLSAFTDRVLIPVSPCEIGMASSAFPLAIVRLQESWQLVAVCGQEANRNLMIKDGQWLGNYLPEACSIYPFEVAAKEGKALPLFDTDSGLLQEGTEGAPFFDAEDKPTGEFAKIMEQLIRRASMQDKLQQMCEALAEAKVLAPWPDELRKRSGININGLMMMNEKALNELDDEAFLQVRKALPLAYAINFSLAQQHIIQRLARLNPEPMSLDEVAETFGDTDDTIKFNF